MSLSNDSGLILAARVGKHTDRLIEELVVTTEGKTDCKRFSSDGWGGYERVLPAEICHYIGKERTQRIERTNGIVRQQTLSLASTTKQIWQGVGTNQSDNSISGRLLQLDMAAQSAQNHGSSTGRISGSTLELARPAHLSHNNLMHYPRIHS